MKRWVLFFGMLFAASACGVGTTLPDQGSLPATVGAGPQSSEIPPAPVLVTYTSTLAPVGVVYYVAGNEPRASDANNGLFPTFQGGQNGPWLTIQHSAKMMMAGDTTYVRTGVYYESGIVFAHSGAPSTAIVLTAYGSEEVILDGTGAKHKSSGIEIGEGRGHYLIQGLTIRNMPRSGIATNGDTSELYHELTIRDCVLHDNGLSGIRLAAVSGFVVENVEAYDNGYYGLDIIGSDDGALSAVHGSVRHSSFHDHTGKEGHGLAINQGHDITVSDSVAFHNRVHGFDVSDWPKGGEVSSDIILERNLSYDNGVAGFAINSDSHHVVYRNNVSYRNGADWAGRGSSSGFLCYEGCWHVEWVNNVSLENTDAGFWVEDQLGRYSTPSDALLIFKNNVTYNNGRPEWRDRPALVVEGEQWQLIATHNNWAGVPGLTTSEVGVPVVYDRGELYTADEINRGAFQTGNISLDPQFVDPTAPDVRLQPGSPCIDAGVDVGLPYQGAAPDMGVYEWGGEAGGFLLISMEAGEYDDVMGEWLGVPMFISCFDPETMKRLVDEAGFEVLETAVETQVEGNHEVPYLWLFARKSSAAAAPAVPDGGPETRLGQ